MATCGLRPLSIDQWFMLAGVIVAAAGLIGGFFYWKDGKREAAATAMRSEVRNAIESIRSEMQSSVSRATTEHTELRKQMLEEHDAITLTVTDLAKTIKGEYVPQREFNIQIRNLDSGITDARSEIGAIGIQVSKVHERIDRLIERRWPGVGDDG